MEQIADWLEGLGMSEYARPFLPLLRGRLAKEADHSTSKKLRVKAA
jgi:hypothetical protein